MFFIIGNLDFFGIIFLFSTNQRPFFCMIIDLKFDHKKKINFLKNIQ